MKYLGANHLAGISEILIAKITHDPRDEESIIAGRGAHLSFQPSSRLRQEDSEFPAA